MRIRVVAILADRWRVNTTEGFTSTVLSGIVCADNLKVPISAVRKNKSSRSFLTVKWTLNREMLNKTTFCFLQEIHKKYRISAGVTDADYQTNQESTQRQASIFEQKDKSNNEEYW